MLDILTIFYTHRIRGQIDVLPRLYAHLQTLRAAHDERAMLLDLGESCDESAWHCGATGGRSSLILLDGMGCHAANVQAGLPDVERRKLDGITSMALVDQGRAWRYDVPPLRDETLIFAVQPVPAMRLCIVLQPAETTQLAERLLWLQGLEGPHQIGMAQVDLRGEMRLTQQEIFSVPAGILPNPTIIGAVEFVEDEARAYLRKQAPPGDSSA